MQNVIEKIIDHLLAEAEFREILYLKHNAVKDQEFDKAADLLKMQREIEGRLLSSDQLRELKTFIKPKHS